MILSIRLPRPERPITGDAVQEERASVDLGAGERFDVDKHDPYLGEEGRKVAELLRAGEDARELRSQTPEPVGRKRR